MQIVKLPNTVLRTADVGDMDNNVYLLTGREDGEQLLIDAAADPEAIEALLASAHGDGPAPHLRHLLTTHRHHDHIAALAAIMAAHPDARTLAGAADADAITEATGVAIDRRLAHGDTITLGERHLTVIGLRGHTPGSVAIALSEPGAPTQLFTGDSLFPGGTGRAIGRENFESLWTDVATRIFDQYPDDTVVWPGHGLPTTLGVERPHLQEWHDRGW